MSDDGCMDAWMDENMGKFKLRSSYFPEVTY